jgi:hypothetical protein
MKRRELILLVTALVMIAGTAATLRFFKTHQHLGTPGLKSTPIPGAMRVHIDFPTNTPGYEARVLPVNTEVEKALPADTSIGQMIYQDSAGRDTLAVAVMMGTDRTSIHKPQFCLAGQGWAIDNSRSQRTTVHFDRPHPLDMPVIKLVASREVESGGSRARYSCVFVYWLVSADDVVADHNQLMWRITSHILHTGELQRWSYLYFMAICNPGQEDAAFAQIARAMNAVVPEVQLTWPAGGSERSAL